MLSIVSTKSDFPCAVPDFVAMEIEGMSLRARLQLTKETDGRHFTIEMDRVNEFAANTRDGEEPQSISLAA